MAMSIWHQQDVPSVILLVRLLYYFELYIMQSNSTFSRTLSSQHLYFEFVGFEGACVNTRDSTGKYPCGVQLGRGSTCVNYLRWKDCDSTCNLCACSTAKGTNGEHCSGHGTCEATCTAITCKGAKCNCDAGWSGDKCELGLY